MTHALPTEYWLSPTALNITLNAIGVPDKTLGSTAAGTMIMVYVKSVSGVIGTYDNGHSYRRWSLQAYNTAFVDEAEKYVYVAIPRDPTNTNALVVYPSVEIDIYGRSDENETDSNGNVIYEPKYEDDGITIKKDESGNVVYSDTPVKKQVGSEDYYFIYLHARISSTDGTTARKWLTEDGTESDSCTINYGSLSTDAAIASAIATIDELLRGMFTPVDNDLNAVTNLDDMKHIRANADFFSVGGVSAYGKGEESTSPTGATKFSELTDVITAGGASATNVGQAWGVVLNSDGTYGYGWITAGSGGSTSSVGWTQIEPKSDTSKQIATISIEGNPIEVYAPNGKTYTGDSNYISVDNTNNKISFLKTLGNLAYKDGIAYDDLTAKLTSTDIQSLVGDYVTTFGGQKGAITARSGSTTNGDVNFSMSSKELQGTVYGLKKLAFKDSLAFSDLTAHPTTLADYGITDAYTKTECDTNYVTALGTKDNYLTWTKNGTTSNITVPYATTAGSVEDVTGIYWADVAISKTSSKATSPTFYDCHMTHDAYFNTLYLNDTSTFTIQTSGGNQYIQNKTGNLYIQQQNSSGFTKIDSRVGVGVDPTTTYKLTSTDSDHYYQFEVGGTSYFSDMVGIGTGAISGFYLATPSILVGTSNDDGTARTQISSGSMELYGANPYIDFHADYGTEDYKVRLINYRTADNSAVDTNYTLELQASNNDPAFKIGDAFLKYDSTNKALYVCGKDNSKINFYAMGGVSAYGGLGSYDDIKDLTISNTLTVGKTATISESLMIGTTTLSESGGNFTINNTVLIDNDLTIGSGSSITVDGTTDTTSLVVGGGTTIDCISFNLSTKKLTFTIGGSSYSVTLS